MSTLVTDMPLSSTTTLVGELTTSFIPTVTKIDISPVSVILAISVVCILSPITVTGNSIILAAFYRYKRLRTASNCLLVSLAISDFGIGVFMPVGIQLELSGLPENGVSALCIVPYCIAIALCSVSVLVTVAIAVDRLTSLAQPLRYKNIITHSSVEKYIAVFWIYAIAVGLSPLIYAQVIGGMQSHSGNCRFDAAVLPPVRVFLVVAVWAPSALVLLGCYMYVYLVARAHARAIYTVELSFRHQTQTLALPRYGQTLAITVGAFFILWLPFQTCMLVDIFYGTNILSEWAVVWLGLPILAHSGANPWIYAFHHGEMRIAAGKIAQDLVALFGVMPGHYGCSPTRCGTNTNLELAEVNYDEESNESRRHPPVEDCFTTTKHKALYKNRCLEISGRHTDISLEKHDNERIASCSSRPGDIIEENIHDLTKMLEPRYIIDRNHIIDSNHNIDKIKNLKYLLDPTFNKIRHLRRLNHKRINGNNLPLIFESEKFISYQNLKSDGSHSNKFLQLNALSDPILNVDTSVVDTKNSNQVMYRVNNVAYQRRNPNLTMSDSNLGAATVHASEVSTRLFPISDNDTERYGYSVQNLNHGYENALARHAMMLCRQMEDQQREGFSKTSSRPRPKFRHFGRVNPNHRLRNGCSSSSSALNNVKTSCETDTLKRSALPHLTITSNKLANLINLDSPLRNTRTPAHIINFTAKTMTQTHRKLEALKHSESINAIGDPVMHRVTLLEPSNLMDSLIVPMIHSEPPSPIDPLPAAFLQAEETQSLEIPRSIVDVAQRTRSPINKRSNQKPMRRSIPIVPTVLLNIEDLSEPFEQSDDQIPSQRSDPPSSGNTSTLEPIDLFEALLRNSDKSKDTRLSEPIFAEHDSTRFSSRRPSDSKWSESSRSQEVLSNAAMEHQNAFPLFYSVNDFQTCNSGSDLNDLTSLDPFMCPDALTSSLRESFFSAPSMPDSDIFTSFEESYEPVFTPDSERDALAYNSMSTMNLKRCAVEAAFQSRSTESVHHVRHPSTRSCTILRVEPAVHSNRLRVRPCVDYILKEPPPVKRNPRLAPLAIPTPTDICTPTFDIVSEIKSDNGIGVRV
ncbi:AA2BR protein, partial [Acromyrmex heyeri]